MTEAVKQALNTLTNHYGDTAMYAVLDSVMRNSRVMAETVVEANLQTLNGYDAFEAVGHYRKVARRIGEARDFSHGYSERFNVFAHHLLTKATVFAMDVDQVLKEREIDRLLPMCVDAE